MLFRSLQWKYPTVEDFLDDADIDDALVVWGKIRGADFAGSLSGFHPTAQAAVKMSLIDPLMSGDEDQIRAVLRKILDYPA